MFPQEQLPVLSGQCLLCPRRNGHTSTRGGAITLKILIGIIIRLQQSKTVDSTPGDDTVFHPWENQWPNPLWKLHRCFEDILRVVVRAFHQIFDSSLDHERSRTAKPKAEQH